MIIHHRDYCILLYRIVRNDIIMTMEYFTSVIICQHTSIFSGLTISMSQTPPHQLAPGSLMLTATIESGVTTRGSARFNAMLEFFRGRSGTFHHIQSQTRQNTPYTTKNNCSGRPPQDNSIASIPITRSGDDSIDCVRGPENSCNDPEHSCIHITIFGPDTAKY